MDRPLRMPGQSIGRRIRVPRTGETTVSRLREAMSSAYVDGLRAVAAAARHVADWSAATPCDQWQAVDLAGHLLAIARYYHCLLDDAEAGRPRSGLPTGRRLESMNAQDLIALSPGRGPDRVAAFLHVAGHYGQRLDEADWDMVLGEWDGVGPLTVLQHTGLVIGEWHIHAWDLARSAGCDHRPADPPTVAAGRARLSGAIQDNEDLWVATLISSGRVLGNL